MTDKHLEPDSNRQDADFAPLLDDSREQRREYRLTGRVRVEVEVEAADPTADQPRRLLSCVTSDISANGIRVHSQEMLPTGALLPMTVHVNERAYLLTVEVMWCREEARGYTIGFQVYESDDASVLEWKEAVAHLLTLG
ncbi:PilZ domain-containing protein [Mangrovitalea sediminis]|uniref:PilZ domain-containing protein n=1 Tax=Mangrovitalea sediminis TaxID=1982043 RepID=UPI000BE5724B|nr:PilZ domain-containing protein [Mangrovitalea sediminis]